MFEKYFECVNNPDDHIFRLDEDVFYFIEKYEQHDLNMIFHELNVPISENCL